MVDTVKWDEMTNEQRDALVAEKVLGLRVEHWTKKQIETIDEDGDPTVWDLRTGYVIPDKMGHPPVPKYTRDMNDAWKVLDKIKEDYPLFVQWQYHLAWMDGEKRSNVRDMLFDLNAERVCKAALMAIGVKIDGLV